MASPQKENGYVAIASEIVEHLTFYRISGEEYQVLWVIFRQTYGWRRKEDAISLSQFHKFTQMKKPSIIRALCKLINKNIIFKKDNKVANIYQFNKNYENWKPLAKKLTTKPLAKKLIKVSKKANKPLAKKLPTIDNIKLKTLLSEKDFEIFYSHYPRKVGKVKAKVLFLRLAKKELPAIMSALEKQKKSNQWENPRYIPHPSTWLNQKRWQDEEPEITVIQDLERMKRECVRKGLDEEQAIFPFINKYGEKEALKYFK